VFDQLLLTPPQVLVEVNEIALLSLEESKRRGGTFLVSMLLLLSLAPSLSEFLSFVHVINL
jgi:hypothetical protein